MYLAIDTKRTIAIYHNDAVQLWAINSFDKTCLHKVIIDENGEAVPYDPFKEINAYISSLTQAKQDELWNIYVVMRHYIDDIAATSKVSTVLGQGLLKIYDIVKIDEVQKFLEKRDLIAIPPSIENQDTRGYRKERTYNPQKYRGLITLAICLRLALPVWGEYIALIGKGVGIDRKEIHSMHLLKGSKLLSSPQYKDFSDFVLTTVEAGKVSKASIIHGIGSEELISLNLAASFIRKVAVAPNLITELLVNDIYNYIANNGPDPDRRHGYIVEKNPKDDTTKEEASILETYRIKESISSGDLELINYYCEMIDKVMLGVDTTVPQELIARCFKMRDTLKDFTPTEMNVRLCQWCLNNIPPRSMVMVDEYAMRSLLCATFGLLIHWGYPQLALLVTAKETLTEDGHGYAISSQRKQMTPELDAALDVMYPLKKGRNKDSINMAKNAINRYFTAHAGKMYVSTYTPYFEDIVKGHIGQEGRHYLKPDTPLQLARMLLDSTKNMPY